MVPQRYREMSLRERSAADYALLKSIQGFYDRPDPLQAAAQLERRAEDGIFFD